MFVATDLIREDLNSSTAECSTKDSFYGALVLEDDLIYGCHVTPKVWHTKELSQRKGHGCRV